MEIPWSSLQAATLAALIEDFVTRDGTDYGQREASLQTKIDQVMKALRSGEIVIVFDPQSETCNIVEKVTRLRDRAPLPLAVCFAITSVLAAVTAPAQAAMVRPNVLSEKPFYWGVASAAFQTEGSPQDSDWYRWTHKDHRVANGDNADTAIDFWNRYDEDFALAQAIGLNSFRISIAWERVEPKAGVFDEVAIAHYSKMIQAMRARGLEPIVTLMHYVVPGWLDDQGGVLAPDFAVRFAEYAQVVVERFSIAPTNVKIWLTLNEPEVQVLAEYLGGQWPPGRFNMRLAARAESALARAHIEAVRLIRAMKDDQIQVSIAKNWTVLQPKHARNPVDQIIYRNAQEIYNFQFVDALMTGRLYFGPAGITRSREILALPDGRPTLDFLGINYYTRNEVSVSSVPHLITRGYGSGTKTDLGWEIYPEGIRQAVEIAYRRWKLPIFVTENGIADATDAHRTDFIQQHLKQLAIAKSEGIPILGYLHWSLTDNFEWVNGYTPRFGLVDIDYSNLKRTPRGSYFEYGAWIKAHPAL